jgi:hypothetical protein
MSRHAVDVIASGMEVIQKHIHKDLGGGHLGLRQVRRTKNIVKDPTLQNINSCMASELAGKTFKDLGEIQDAFKTAREGPCATAKQRPSSKKK